MEAAEEKPLPAYIIEALAWLDELEPAWNLQKPIDRDEFISELMRKGERK